MDAMIGMIDGKEKNINVFTKTKIDWDHHTKKNELTDELDKNRKSGGFLGKRAFIE